MKLQAVSRVYTTVPLSSRVSYSKDCEIDIHTTDVTPAPLHPSNYLSWRGSLSINMAKACRAFNSGQCSLRKVAELYGVPKSTLHDHASGKVKEFNVSGPERYLSVHDEEELCNFLIGCSEIGYPRTRPQVLAIVQQYIDKKKINKIVSGEWWQKFRSRHPNITLRSAAPLSLPRAKAADRSVLDKILYYTILKSTLKDNGIFNKPRHIYNCDETGFPLSPKSPKTVAERGAQNPSSVTSSTKNQLTVLCCVNAAGDVIPPFVIIDRKRFNTQYAVGEVPDTRYGLSPKGWIDTALFQDWFTNHFLTYVPAVRPLLLIMDGHSSHYSPDMIRIAADEGILLFVLPPNTTNLTQPLDKGVFAALKVAWKQVCHRFLMENPGRVISRYDFSTLLHEAWDECMTIKNIKSGFQTTGICPFNKDAVTLPGEDKLKEFNPHSLAMQTGLKYIPLYSSSPMRPSHSRICGSSSNDNSTAMSDASNSNASDEPSDTPANKLNHRSGGLSEMLDLPQAPSKLPTKYPKSSGCVITLEEQMAINAEKERAKKEKENLKVAANLNGAVLCRCEFCGEFVDRVSAPDDRPRLKNKSTSEQKRNYYLSDLP